MPGVIKLPADEELNTPVLPLTSSALRGGAHHFARQCDKPNKVIAKFWAPPKKKAEVQQCGETWCFYILFMVKKKFLYCATTFSFDMK